MREPAALQVYFYRKSLFHLRYDVNFHPEIVQKSASYGGADGVGWSEICFIHFVECVEVLQCFQMHGGFYDIIHLASGGFKDSGDVFHHLVRLFLDGVRNFLRGRINGALSRYVMVFPAVSPCE